MTLSRPKPKKCKQCGELFIQQRMGQKTCDYQCALAFNRVKETQELKRKRLAQSRELRARKEALKTPHQLWSAECKRAQDAVCLYVRVRDRDEACISCGRSVAEVESVFSSGGYWDGGHYLAKGSHPELRFNTWNIHKQCKTCNGGENRHRSAVKAVSVREGYTAGLTLKIGAERLAWLTGPHKPLQPDIEYLSRVKKIFNKRARHLAKLRQYR